MNVYVKHGLAFEVMSEFEDSDDGHIAANKYIADNEGAAVLHSEGKGGNIIIAHKNDKGVPVSAEVLL